MVLQPLSSLKTQYGAIINAANEVTLRYVLAVDDVLRHTSFAQAEYTDRPTTTLTPLTVRRTAPPKLR
jgi:hypothetical protein